MQPLTLSLIQTGVHWHDASANRTMFNEWFEKVPRSSQVIVLPEMFNSGFSMSSQRVAETMTGPTLGWLREQARRLDKIVCGSLVIETERGYFNRFVWVQPDGAVTSYDKRHLFRMAAEHKHYQPGGEHIIVKVGGWRICPLVCYDLRFPVWFRNRGDSDLLLCVANWPAARQRAWNTLLQARAIENLTYAVGVNRVGTDGNGVSYRGGTAAYDFQGETLLEIFDEAAIETLVLDAGALKHYRESFPAWQDADQFSLDP